MALPLLKAALVLTGVGGVVYLGYRMCKKNPTAAAIALRALGNGLTPKPEPVRSEQVTVVEKTVLIEADKANYGGVMDLAQRERAMGTTVVISQKEEAVEVKVVTPKVRALTPITTQAQLEKTLGKV